MKQRRAPHPTERQTTGDTESAGPCRDVAFELPGFASASAPVDVHNQSTTVARLPEALLEAMRSPSGIPASRLPRVPERETAPDLEIEAKAAQRDARMA